MTHTQDFDFVTELARDLTAGDISLPSFPDVVLKIRHTLEDENASLQDLRKAISIDAALTSRLLVFANSSYHNPAGNPIDSLDGAINRLGLELIRNTAVSLAVRQMFLAEQHKAIAPALRELWQSSMQRASMAFAIATQLKGISDETAFLCGLLHEVGKLYILTKAADFPEFLGNEDELQQVIAGWHPKIGKSIVESWNFSDEVAITLDLEDCSVDRGIDGPELVDVIQVANRLLAADADDDVIASDDPAVVRVKLDSEMQYAVMTEYNNKLNAVRETLTR